MASPEYNNHPRPFVIFLTWKKHPYFVTVIECLTYGKLRITKTMIQPLKVEVDT